MFGDLKMTIAEEMLTDFTLEEILEMNNLTEEEVLNLLIEEGHVSHPERFFDTVQRAR